MDKEQQIRLNFLDEAEDCFDQIESVLLGLANKIAESQQLDLALRAAHSVKGGAGMMGFKPLSHIAHRLEDFFKILRLRYHSSQISVEVESLMLQGVDSLRQVSNLHRQGTEIDDSLVNEQIEPIFAQLSQYLGELNDEDENALFNQDEVADSELLLFEDEVENVLNEFELQLEQFPPSELSQALSLTIEQLMVFSQMADVDNFTQLCQSIQQQVNTSNLENIHLIAQEALNIWKRSHALVCRRSLEKIPCELQLNLEPIEAAVETETTFVDNPFPVEELESDFPILQTEIPTLNEIESLALNFEQAQTDFEQFDEPFAEELTTNSELSELLPDLNPEYLAEIKTAFVQAEETPIILNEPTTTELEEKSLVNNNVVAEQKAKMVRVPVEQLYQLNNLFGQLILERNTVNLRLEQLKTFALVMRQRMNQLEKSHTKLRKWYDRASLEGIREFTEAKIEDSLPKKTLVNSLQSLNQDDLNSQFDSLEMDRYSDLHLISQEQIETIVQLEEVTGDIEIGLQEINQAVGTLNQTTKAMQTNLSRTQMVSFQDVAKLFPRLIRDLSLQFGKQVNLHIEGESTLIDRAIVEALNAPLTHLLRNAFDHGIEEPEKRMKLGKPPEGTITLRAINRGTETLIFIEDDGGGIALSKIKNRLPEMGIGKQKIEQMSESEILNYIFEPGFSTANQVTELSGRGVGLDVVKTNLQEIRGDVNIQTKIGHGTTFILSLPLNLSILRVMILERAGMIFAVPADTIREIVRLESQEINYLENIHQLTWNEQTIPVVEIEKSLVFNRPHKPFEMSGNPLIKKPTALIIGKGTSVGGLYLDRVWEEQEVTIRPIESPIPLPFGFVSSIVLGDGRVIPLVDPFEILEGCLEGYLSATDYNSNSPDEFISGQENNTILIVDDSINVRRYLALTLEKAGYQVEQAKDGQEAVDKLFNGLSVQAVICDIEMPRLDGYGVLEEVKAESQFKDLPIVMLTSRSNDKHRRLAMNLGASAYFSKPYNENQLLQKLASLTLQGKNTAYTKL